MTRRIWTAAPIAASLLLCVAAFAQNPDSPPTGYEPIPGEPTQLPDEPAPASPTALPPTESPVPPPPKSAGDEYDPDPNRLPGPKHFTPEVCKSAPEVCKARREALRQRYQECLDAGRTDCSAPPAEKKPMTRKKAKPPDETPPPSTQPQR